LHLGQAGDVNRVPGLRLARTALPVPPQAGHRSFFTSDFDFLKIILLDPFGCPLDPSGEMGASPFIRDTTLKATT
jgi:hypothetical protein